MAETIAKLDAAKRQLTVAIRLFFNRADPVAIHTLAAAAYQILYDLSKSRGVIGVVKGNPNVRKDKRAECVFQSKVATDSGRTLPPIPVEGCH